MTDANLRWLYASSRGVISAAYEDFGLTPIEGAAFGRPTVALRSGGFLDTVIDGVTGSLFEQADPVRMAAALDAAGARSWDEPKIRVHADRFSFDRFAADVQLAVAQAAGGA
jgi:glycosyltransferase involved in cell wall biosynthesis